MSYSERAIAFSKIPTGHQVRLEDRVSFAYLDMSTVFQNRTGVWAMQNDDGEKVKTAIQIPVGGIAVVALGPGTSITQPAIISLTRSGATVVFAGNGGAAAYAAATPLTSSARWAIAQARLVTNETAASAAAIKLYKKQLGVEMLPGGTVNAMRGAEGRAMRDLYRNLSKKHGIKDFHRDTQGPDPVNQGLNLGNALLYGCASAACTAIGANPALGIIHRGDSRSLLFDLADLYKPTITIPLAFEAASEEDPAMTLRIKLRSSIHKKKILEGMVAALMGVLTPHLPERDDDRIIGEEIEASGHTNHGAA